MTEQIMTIKEVAGYLKVHERTVYRLAAKGELPAFKVANAWRFRLQDIDHWISQQTRSPAGAANAAEADRGGES
ncbi:MAG: methylation-associated defense system helix-turn-helix domain-containing protein MAD1 [Pseudomonadota bacterium]